MWNQTLRMNVCVGAFAAASDGVGICSLPIRGISVLAGPIAGASGPFTQQHAGRRSRDNRTVVIEVRMATGFHGTCIRTDEQFTKGAEQCADSDAAHGAPERWRLAGWLTGVSPLQRITRNGMETCRPAARRRRARRR